MAYFRLELLGLVKLESLRTLASIIFDPYLRSLTALMLWYIAVTCSSNHAVETWSV